MHAARLHRGVTGIAAVLLLGLPLLLACHPVVGESGTQSGGTADAGLVQEVMKRVERSYVEPVPSEKLASDALKGMLAGLDPHSSYMDEREYQQMQSELRGEFGGIGVQLALQNGVPAVISPIEGGPAARAGIDPGDRIIKIDGQSTKQMPLDEIVGRLRGLPGTKVNVEILRANQAPFEISLTRSVVSVVSVKSSLERDKIGYIHISGFSEQTPSAFASAIERLKQQAGGHLNGLVLDLRNDPGGLLDSAVEVAGNLIDGGTVVTVRGRERGGIQVYTAPAHGDLIRGTPMVVLINSASASASEIVAGTLQDHRRATVMGTSSFGKGSVQSIFPLNGRGALRLTTARYYTPSGRSIQDHGIVPDVVVGLPRDEQVPNTVITREADLPGALKNTGALDGDRTTTSATAPVPGGATGAEADAHPIDPALIGTAKDTQLEAAIKYLLIQRADTRHPLPSGAHSAEHGQRARNG
jgi:carboxyl-terminal processing protease